MRQLGARLRAAREQRRGELCVLVGPPGIGKTRCLDELAAAVEANDFDFWIVRCVEDAWAPSFLPWMRVLREVARGRPVLHERVDALLARLREAAASEAQLAAPDHSYWWLDGVTRLLIDAAAERALVIGLDDLQWADAASLELLAFLAAELRREPIVVIAGLRSEALFEETPALKRLWRHACRIDLDLLTEAEVARYVKESVASDEMRPDTLAALHRLTAGNPLFLEHTLRAVLARRGNEPLAQLSPSTISPAPIARDLLRTTLDRLEPAVRELLGVASVLAEIFDLSDLQALCRLEPEELLRLLAPAVREAIVIADEPSTLHFCHALMRTVLYDDLTMPQKATLHRRAAEALERSDPSRLGEIAHHHYRSRALGGLARVTTAAERAAQAAARLGACADASRYCAWAVETQALEAHTEPRARAELLLFHAEMQGKSGAMDAARTTIAAVVEIARSHRLTELLVRSTQVLRPYTLMASLEDPYLRSLLEEALIEAPTDASDTRVSALSQLAWMPPYAHDTTRSKAMSGEALALAREVRDEKLVLQALSARLHALSGPDDCDALLATADEMQSLQRLPDAWTMASIFSARYGAHLHRGDMLGASAARAELGKLAHAHHWPTVIWVHDRLVVQESILRADFAAAIPAFEALQQLAERWQITYTTEMHLVIQGLITLELHGIDALLATVDRAVLPYALQVTPIGLRPMHARLELALGDRESARAVLTALAANDFAGVPRDIGYLGALASLAVLAVGLDETAHAKALYRLLAPYSQFITMNLLLLHEGSVSHFLGVLAAYLGDHIAAERHFEDALAINERIGHFAQLKRTRRERDRGRAAASGIPRLL